MVDLVTLKESQEARRRAHNLINKVRNHKKIKGHYKFFCNIIGSRARGCVVKDLNGKYDFDFQIILTKNSKNGDKNPTEIKKDFFRAFTDCKNKSEKFSFDFVIIKTVIYGKERR